MPLETYLNDIAVVSDNHIHAILGGGGRQGGLAEPQQYF
jgi:hypothetical protein